MSRTASRDELDRVRRRLDEWRHTRAHPRSPIPKTVWARAVRLARRHGLAPTARVLRVDYTSLKRHVEATQAAARPQPAFVELPPAPAREAGAYGIALTGPRATVHIRLTGVALAEVATLSRMLVGVDA